MSEINWSPVQEYIPDVAYPKAFAKVVATYEAAQQAWRSAYAEVVAADAALSRAPAEDQAALVAAVKAGKPHPGQAREDAARQALAMAEERCRVARELATAQADIVKASRASAVDELVDVFLDNYQAKSDAYGATLESCKQTEEQARRDLDDARSAIRSIGRDIERRFGFQVHWDGNTAQPTWPSHPGNQVQAQIERVQLMIGQAKAAEARKPEAS